MTVCLVSKCLVVELTNEPSEPEIAIDCSGPTFSHVFGTNTSAFELLVLKRKIMGPCWLEIKGAALSSKSVSLAT